MSVLRTTPLGAHSGVPAYQRTAPRWFGRLLIVVAGVFLLLFTFPRTLQYLDVMGWINLGSIPNLYNPNFRGLRHHNDFVLLIHLLGGGVALIAAGAILSVHLMRPVTDLTVSAGRLHAVLGSLFLAGSAAGVPTAYILSFTLTGSPYLLAELAWTVVLPYLIGTTIWGGCVILGTVALVRRDRTSHMIWMIGAASYMLMFVTHRFGVVVSQWSGWAFQDQSADDLARTTFLYALITYVVLILHGAMALYFAGAVRERERWRERDLLQPSGTETVDRATSSLTATSPRLRAALGQPSAQRSPS